jgi:hypothetical protein
MVEGYDGKGIEIHGQGIEIHVHHQYYPNKDLTMFQSKSR